MSSCSTYVASLFASTARSESSAAVRPEYVIAPSTAPSGSAFATALSSDVFPWPGGASTSVSVPGLKAHSTRRRTRNSWTASSSSSSSSSSFFFASRAPALAAIALKGAIATAANASGTVTILRSTVFLGRRSVYEKSHLTSTVGTAPFAAFSRLRTLTYVDRRSIVMERVSVFFFFETGPFSSAVDDVVGGAPATPPPSAAAFSAAASRSTNDLNVVVSPRFDIAPEHVAPPRAAR